MHGSHIPRFSTLLAPDIIEAILMGEEPSGLSLTMLTKQLPTLWDKQWHVIGLPRNEC